MSLAFVVTKAPLATTVVLLDRFPEMRGRHSHHPHTPDIPPPFSSFLPEREEAKDLGPHQSNLPNPPILPVGSDLLDGHSQGRTSDLNRLHEYSSRHQRKRDFTNFLTANLLPQLPEETF